MNHLLAELQNLGLPAVFITVLAEQCGIPVPAFAFLVIAGSWLGNGQFTAPALLATAVAACLIADSIWYAAGQRWGTRALKTLCRVSLEPDSCVSSTERTFERFGTRSLLIAKFVPGLGAIATAMSGVRFAARRSFYFFDLLGSLLWAGTAITLGHVFRDAIDDVFDTLAGLGRVGLLLAGVLLVIYLGQKLVRRHLLIRELRVNRITVDELRQLMESSPKPLIVDARTSLHQQRDGLIPGSVSFDSFRSDVYEPDERREVIVYCACPNEVTAARIARQLIDMGFRRVRPLQGGIHAWQDAGFTVEFPDGQRPAGRIEEFGG